MQTCGRTFADGLRHQPVVSWSHWWPLAISATQSVADWMRVLTQATVKGQHTSRQPPLQREEMRLKINIQLYRKEMFDWFHFPRLCFVHPTTESKVEIFIASWFQTFFFYFLLNQTIQILIWRLLNTLIFPHDLPWFKLSSSCPCLNGWNLLREDSFKFQTRVRLLTFYSLIPTCLALWHTATLCSCLRVSDVSASNALCSRTVHRDSLLVHIILIFIHIVLQERCNKDGSNDGKQIHCIEAMEGQRLILRSRWN